MNFRRWMAVLVLAGMIGGVLVIRMRLSGLNPASVETSENAATKSVSTSQVVGAQTGQNSAADRGDAATGAGVSNAAKTVSAGSLPASPPMIVQKLRDEVLSGRYGSMPIQEVLLALGDVSGGPEIQEILKALAVRKAEALPLVQEMLRTGEWWEKHMVTKLLRYSPWPETYPDLLALALSRDEHWLARQGALYALGALGNSEAGARLLSVLNESDCPQGVQLVAIATLAQLGYTPAIDAIRPFAQSKDAQIRIFSNRALAELGQPADRLFLLSALEHPDYFVRAEACAALGIIAGDYVVERLQAAAMDDSNEAVRISATEALLQQEMRGQSQAQKLDILTEALRGANRRVDSWVVQKMLDECGSAGHAAVEQLALREDSIGERAGTFLIWVGAR
jgi:hypothetical protein